MRVVKELPKGIIKSVSACDLSEFSRSVFCRNLELNGLDQTQVSYTLGDTNKVLINSQFDVIDLDPYGSMIPFLFAAIHALGSRGKPGLLCVTCTDTKVLMGPERHKCYYDYGSARGGTDCLEESALRIALYAVSRVASIQQKSIRVLLAVHSDFYIRMFIEVSWGKKGCWKTLAQHGNQLNCLSCGSQWAHTFGHFENDKIIFNRPEACSPCKHCGDSVAFSSITRRTSVD